MSAEKEVLGLGDILSPEMVKRLYLDPREAGGNRNPFASRALDHDIRKLFDAYATVHAARYGVYKKAGQLETGDGASTEEVQSRMLLKRQLEKESEYYENELRKLVAVTIDGHAKRYAPQLEEALKNMGIPQGQIDQLPRDKDGNINDSLFTFRNWVNGVDNTGSRVLLEQVYDPQIKGMFSLAPQQKAAGRGR